MESHLCLITDGTSLETKYRGVGVGGNDPPPPKTLALYAGGIGNNKAKTTLHWSPYSSMSYGHS